MTRRTTWAAAVLIGGLMAGCGSSSKTTPTTPPTTPPGSTTGAGPGAMAHTGTAGTMGPPTSGKYNATNPTVVEHIDGALVKFFTAKGFSGVTANCTGTSPTTASCKVTGTNSSGQTSSAVLTIAVNPTTGVLKVVHVAS